MPKTKDAFAFCQLYNQLATALIYIKQLDDTELIIPEIKAGYNEQTEALFGYLMDAVSPDFSFPPTPRDFKAQKLVANFMVKMKAAFPAKKRHLNKHIKRIDVYKSAITKKLVTAKEPGIFIDKLRKAETLLDKYLAISGAFDEYTEIFDSNYKEEVMELGRLYNKELGARLRSERYKLNLTQEEVAQKLGMSAVGYSYYERGEREISPFTLYRLSRIGMDVEKILGFNQ